MQLRAQFEEILPKEHLALFGKYQTSMSPASALEAAAPAPAPDAAPAAREE